MRDHQKQDKNMIDVVNDILEAMIVAACLAIFLLAIFVWSIILAGL